MYSYLENRERIKVPPTINICLELSWFGDTKSAGV